MRQRTRPGSTLRLISVIEWAGTQVRWLRRTGGAEVTHNLIYFHHSPVSGIMSALSTCPHLLCGKGNLSGAGNGNAFRQNRFPLTCTQRLDPQIAEKQRGRDVAILVWYALGREKVCFITLLCLLLFPGASLSSSFHSFCRAHKPKCNLLCIISP